MDFGDPEEQAVRNQDEDLIKLPERARNVNLRLSSNKMKLKGLELRTQDHRSLSKQGWLKTRPEEGQSC